MSTVPPLLHALVDDAALFPPGNAPMRDAVAAHPLARSSWYGEVVGRFLCPASRLPELLRVLPPAARLELGVVADTGLAGLPGALGAVAADDRLSLTAVEVRLPTDVEPEGWVADLAAVLTDGPAGVRAFVEVARRPGWLDVLPVLRAAGLGAKLRCGGLEPGAVPGVDEVADFVASCVQQGLPFKCTAGLHAAVRHHDPATGQVQHGFANVLAGTVAALAGAGRPEVAAVLAVEGAGPLVTVLSGVDDRTAAAARDLFTAYGSCSIFEPVDDLLALGLVSRGATG